MRMTGKKRVLYKATIRRMVSDGQWLATAVEPPRRNSGYKGKGDNPAMAFESLDFSGGVDYDVIFEIQAIKRERV